LNARFVITLPEVINFGFSHFNKSMNNKFRLFFLLIILTMALSAACQRNSSDDRPTPDAARNDLTLRGYKFDEASFFEAVKQGDLRAINGFLAAGMSPDTKGGSSSSGETVLTAAISKGDAKIVKALLGGKADPNVPNKIGETPLTLATAAAKVDLIDLLLNAKADVNLPGKDGQTPLYIAVNANRADIAAKYLERGADVNKTEKNGESPLIAAAVNGDLNTVQELIKRGANVNQQSKTGGSALLYAASEGYPEIAAELLKAGAKKDLKDSKGNTPLDWAKKNKKTEVINILK
jgi:ankyrin repeat protein